MKGRPPGDEAARRASNGLARSRRPGSGRPRAAVIRWLAAGALLAAACAHAPPSSPSPGHAEPDLVGLMHVVKRGETVYRIAKAYGLSPRELMDVNGISDPRTVAVGTELFVPGAVRLREVPALTGSPPEPEVVPPEPDAVTAPSTEKPALRWPLRGVLYSRYGIRQGQRHDGIDISAPEGTHIGAAASGTVVFAGEQAGYGSIVILRHGGRLLTVYAHASALLVREGQQVAAGQPIARVGHSGRTTGPHLHFEVREGTRPRNPLSFLP